MSLCFARLVASIRAAIVSPSLEPLQVLWLRLTKFWEQAWEACCGAAVVVLAALLLFRGASHGPQALPDEAKEEAIVLAGPCSQSSSQSSATANLKLPCVIKDASHRTYSRALTTLTAPPAPAIQCMPFKLKLADP